MNIIKKFSLGLLISLFLTIASAGLYLFIPSPEKDSLENTNQIELKNLKSEKN